MHSNRYHECRLAYSIFTSSESRGFVYSISTTLLTSDREFDLTVGGGAFFFRLFSLTTILALLFSLPSPITTAVVVVTQIRGHKAGAPPPILTRVRAFIKTAREKTSALSSLVDSRLIAPIPTLRALTSSFFFFNFWQVHSQSHAGWDSNSHEMNAININRSSRGYHYLSRPIVGATGMKTVHSTKTKQIRYDTILTGSLVIGRFPPPREHAHRAGRKCCTYIAPILVTWYLVNFVAAVVVSCCFCWHWYLPPSSKKTNDVKGGKKRLFVRCARGTKTPNTKQPKRWSARSYLPGTGYNLINLVHGIK